jgi:5'-nucleotidase
MSNADISGEALLRDVIQKSAVIEQRDENIGLIGLTMQDTDELASPGPNVVFSDPFSAVQAELISSQPWV